MDARRRWFVPAGLFALSVIPIAAGAAILSGLATDAKVTAENKRFFATPVG